jgi:hypothetical protein
MQHMPQELSSYGVYVSEEKRTADCTFWHLLFHHGVVWKRCITSGLRPLLDITILFRGLLQNPQNGMNEPLRLILASRFPSRLPQISSVWLLYLCMNLRTSSKLISVIEFRSMPPERQIFPHKFVYKWGQMVHSVHNPKVIIIHQPQRNNSCEFWKNN